MEIFINVLVMLQMALTHQEDRAMLESNPSAWRGSAGDRGVALNSHPPILLWLSLPEPKR